MKLLTAKLIEIQNALKDLSRQSESATKSDIIAIQDKLKTALAAYTELNFFPEYYVHFAHISKYVTRLRINHDQELQLACNELMQTLSAALYQHPFFQQPTWQDLLAAADFVNYPQAQNDPQTNLLAEQHARELAKATQELADQMNEQAMQAMQQLQSKTKFQKNVPEQELAQQALKSLEQATTLMAISAATFATADLALAWLILF